MSLRKYYIDLVEGKKKGFASFLAKLFLFPLSFLYWAVVNLRNYLYDKNFILKEKDFKIPVISIGNLTWGGTGKTSLLVKLVSALTGFKIAVLSRGYGEDELALMRRSFLNKPVELFAGKNRLKILENIGSQYDLAILDDSFQYRKIKKDLELLLINGKDPFGKGWLLPLGKLREPLLSIKRADLAVIIYSGDKNLENILKKINPSLEVFYGRYKPIALRDFEGNYYSGRDFLNKPLAFFCAIGYPQGFFLSLKEFGFSSGLRFIYPDHHILKEREFKKIEKKCFSLGIKDLIITAKDRFRFRFPTKLSIFILEVDLEIDRFEYLLSLVKNVLADKRLK